MLDGLRLRGLLDQLGSRARAKSSALEHRGLRDRHDDEALLIAWLTDQTGGSCDNGARFLYEHGYHDVEELLRALRREAGPCGLDDPSS